MTGSGANYTVTANLTAPITQPTNLEIHLRTSSTVDIIDASNNPFDTTQRNLTTGGFHYILNTTVPDNTNPTILTISRTNNASQNIDSVGAISWDINFDEPVEQVDLTDFTVRNGRIVGTIGVTGSGASYTITATLTAPTTQLTDLPIHLRTSANADIRDASNNSFDNSERNLTTGGSHYILNTTVPDTTAPTILTIARTNNASQTINSLRTISWTITFDESVTRVNPSDFTVNVANIVGTIGVTDTGTSYTVTATLTAPSRASDLPIHLRPSSSYRYP